MVPKIALLLLEKTCKSRPNTTSTISLRLLTGEKRVLLLLLRTKATVVLAGLSPPLVLLNLTGLYTLVTLLCCSPNNNWLTALVPSTTSVAMVVYPLKLSNTSLPSVVFKPKVTILTKVLIMNVNTTVLKLLLRF